MIFHFQLCFVFVKVYFFVQQNQGSYSQRKSGNVRECQGNFLGGRGGGSKKFVKWSGIFFVGEITFIIIEF